MPGFTIPHFDTAAQWLTQQIGRDMLPIAESAQPAPGAAALRRWMGALLADMAAHPAAYEIPLEPFIEVYEQPLQETHPQHEAAQAQRLKARKAIEQGALDFLYRFGQDGQLAEGSLSLARPVYEALLAEKRKLVKKLNFLARFEALGLQIQAGAEEVALNVPGEPALPGALSALAKGSAAAGKDGFFFFRRCDFGVLQGKRLPALEDALSCVPEVLRAQLQAVDEGLRARRYRREILVNPWADGGYRLRYTRKGGQAVYWFRIYNWTNYPLCQQLRWDMRSDLSARLFARLDETAPGVALRVFESLKTCRQCYENCAARAVLAYRGRERTVCSDAGWFDLGLAPADFALLNTVLDALEDCF